MCSYRCLCVVCVLLDAATLTEVFPCFFLCCKANARVHLAKTGHGPHSHKLLCCLCILIVSLCTLIVVYVFLDAATLTEVFPCFFLSCKANARVNLAKTGHGPHSHKLLCCFMYCLFCVVLCIVCV